jgi:hypothetical protein
MQGVELQGRTNSPLMDNSNAAWAVAPTVAPLPGDLQQLSGDEALLRQFTLTKCAFCMLQNLPWLDAARLAPLRCHNQPSVVVVPYQSTAAARHGFSLCYHKNTHYIHFLPQATAASRPKSPHCCHSAVVTSMMCACCHAHCGVFACAGLVLLPCSPQCTLMKARTAAKQQHP